MTDRLTDEKWRGMLESGAAPEQPAWVGNFKVQQGENSLLQMAVFEFQRSITDAYWNVGWMEFEDGDPLLAFSADLEALRSAGQYMGHQLVSSQPLSFDLQSDTRAVVVVQETWQDSLYTGEYPDVGVEPDGQRGPYSLQATYTLELKTLEWGTRWQVVSVSIQGSAPNW
jgi:hypothetical protein